MRYNVDDDSSIVEHMVVAKPQKDILDLAEQLMNVETSEGFGSNILMLYQELGEYLWSEDPVASADSPSSVTSEAHGFMLDKLIEVSYIMHREKWRKVRVGSFKQNWAMQATANDDLDFERYLTSLKP